MAATEWNEDEFNEDMKALERMEEEGKEIYQAIDTASEWLDIHSKTESILYRFIENMKGIECVIENLPEKDNSKQRFLIATLLGGVISAYEGMVHNFVTLLMKNKNYRKEENLKKIKVEDLERLNIKKHISWDDLVIRLNGATLNRPNLVARILNALFEFNIPEGDEEEIKNLIAMRNDFTHNNGINSEGKEYDVSWEYLTSFLSRMDGLVATYVNSMQPHVDDFLRKS